MIMRDGELATMIQHQEEEKVQKLIGKEQQGMTSMSIGKALLLVQRALYLHNFLQSSIRHNLGVASKVSTLAMKSMFFFSYCLLHLQAVFRVAGNKSIVDVVLNYTNLSSLGVICINGLMKPTERITNIATGKLSCLPTYDLWYLGCILYHIFFGSPLYNFDSQQMNSLL